MRCFPNIQSVHINDANKRRAKEFAHQVVGTVNYRDSNQTTKTRIENDHYISKIGEEAVKAVFEKLGHRVKGPDYTIYNGREKSWEHDLYVNDRGLAIKTQTASAAQRYGLSWTFQASATRRDPILNQPNAWVCFVEYDEAKNVCRVFPPYQICELSFGEPRLAHLKGTKKVVYLEDMMEHQKQIRLIEELSANAWCAHTNQVLEGWRLRWNDGITGRANSVWASNIGENTLAVEDRIQIAEEFYQRRNTAVRFHITPVTQPTHLDSILESRGYAVITPTNLEIASVADVLARSKSNQSVNVSEKFNEEWYSVYLAAEQANEFSANVRRGILQRIGPHAGYALLKINDQTAAIGLGVVERGWVGLFSIETKPEFRKQGAATSVIRALMEWGKSYGAANTYLQVVETNTPALKLYEKLGFKFLYRYHYREKK